MELKEIMNRLEALKDENKRKKMAYYNVRNDNAYGISTPDLRKIAREIKTNHKLALELWETKIFEAMVLATLIIDINEINEDLMDKWVMDLDSWAICDSLIVPFEKTEYAIKKAFEWADREEEYVRRAGFSLMARISCFRKTFDNDLAVKFLDKIKEKSGDERNFVKKAINWALREIGKRDNVCKKMAIDCAIEMKDYDSKSARWIASDAYRELNREGVNRRIKKR